MWEVQVNSLISLKKFTFNGSYNRDKEDFSYSVFENINFITDESPTSFFRCDFRGTKFVDVNFYKNNFDRADFISSVFINVNFRYVDIAACEMKNCYFSNVFFKGNMYNNTSIQECTFCNCTFDNENLLINMKNCSFTDCKILSCQFERSTTEKISFNHCEIVDSDFANMHAERFKFRECILSENSFDICYIFGYLFYKTDICNINIIYMGEILEFNEENVKTKFSINLWEQHRYYEFINSNILFGKYRNIVPLLQKAFSELTNLDQYARKLEIYNILDMLTFYAHCNAFDFQLIKSVIEYFDAFKWDVFELEEKIIYLAQYNKFKTYITETGYNEEFINTATNDFSFITFYCDTDDYEFALKTVEECITKIYNSLNLPVYYELLHATKGSWILTFSVISACALLLPKLIRQYSDLYLEINTKRSISKKLIEKMNKKNMNIAEFKVLSDIAIETGLLKEDKIEFDDLGKIVEAIKVGI